MLKLIVSFSRPPALCLLPPASKPQLKDAVKSQKYIYRLLEKIPDSASVSATNNIIPHLSGRRALLRLPIIEFRNDNQEAEKVDYIIADLWELERYGVVFTKEKGWLEEINGLIEGITANKEYKVIDVQDNVVLLRKI